MPFTNKEPLNYPPNSPSSIRIYQADRAPLITDYKNFIVGDEWNDTSSTDFWKLVFKDATQGVWRKMVGTSAAVESFLPDSGTTPVVPDSLNRVTVTGGTGVEVVGGLNTLTWNIDGDIAQSYVTDAGTATPAANILNVFGGNNIDTSGAGNTVTVDLISITDHALIVGSGAAAVTEIGPLTNGQLAIGSTGADPVAANLTSTGGSITITNAAGSINLETTSSLNRSSFLAYLATQANNVTGDGTIYTILYDTVVYNIGSDFAVGTGIYTAPYDGIYMFMISCRYLLGAGGYTQIRHLLHTSSGDHYGNATANAAMIVTDIVYKDSIILSLAAGATVWTTLDIRTALKDCDIRGTVSGGTTNNNYTFFTGSLLYRT